jgi:hypothetical protein
MITADFDAFRIGGLCPGAQSLTAEAEISPLTGRDTSRHGRPPSASGLPEVEMGCQLPRFPAAPSEDGPPSSPSSWMDRIPPPSREARTFHYALEVPPVTVPSHCHCFRCLRSHLRHFCYLHCKRIGIAGGCSGASGCPGHPFPGTHRPLAMTYQRFCHMGKWTWAMAIAHGPSAVDPGPWARGPEICIIAFPAY